MPTGRRNVRTPGARTSRRGRFVVRIAGIRFAGEPREDWAYTMLAGPIAARMHTGVWNLAPDDEGVTRVARYLSHCPLGDPAQATGRARAWTALNLVEETSFELWRIWSAVESVTRYLLARKALAADEVRARALMAAPPTRSPRPLAPTADEVLRELEVVLRQNQDLELGDWRACPREALTPSGPPTLEPVPPGEAFRQQTLRARPKPPSKPVKPTRKARRPSGSGAGRHLRVRSGPADAPSRNYNSSLIAVQLIDVGVARIRSRCQIDHACRRLPRPVINAKRLLNRPEPAGALDCTALRRPVAARGRTQQIANRQDLKIRIIHRRTEVSHLAVRVRADKRQWLKMLIETNKRLLIEAVRWVDVMIRTLVAPLEHDIERAVHSPPKPTRLRPLNKSQRRMQCRKRLGQVRRCNARDRHI